MEIYSYFNLNLKINSKFSGVLSIVDELNISIEDERVVQSVIPSKPTNAMYALIKTKHKQLFWNPFQGIDGRRLLLVTQPQLRDLEHVGHCGKRFSGDFSDLDRRSFDLNATSTSTQTGASHSIPLA